MQRTRGFHRALNVFSEISYCFKNCFTVFDKIFLILLVLLLFSWKYLHADLYKLEAIDTAMLNLSGIQYSNLGQFFI